MSQLALDSLMFACLFLKYVEKYFVLLSGAFPLKEQRRVLVRVALPPLRQEVAVLCCWCGGPAHWA